MNKSPLILVAAILTAVPLKLSADTLYWDLTDSLEGAGGDTPSGTWSTGIATWNTVPDGSGSLVPWTDNSDAVFSAGSDATGTYSITTSVPINVLSLTVEDGKVITNTTSANRVAVGTGGMTINPGATYSFLGSTQSLQTATGATPILTLNGGTLENRVGANGSTFLPVGFQVVVAGTGGTFNMPGPGLTSHSFNYLPTVGISGSGGLTLQGNTIQFRTGTATYSYTGPTIITSTGGPMEFKQNTTTNNILPIDTDLTVGTNDNIAVFNLGLANAQVASLSGNGIVAATSTNTSPALRTLTINGSTPANDSTFSGIIQNYYNDLNTAPNTNGVVVLTKNGTSSLTLTGLNSQTGTTTLNDGTITVSSSGALSGAAAPLTVNGGTLNLNNPAQTVSTLTGAASGNLVLGVGHTLMTDPAAGSTFAGTISGPGGLTKLNVLSGATARTLILSGNNTYDGPTTISGGTIQVGSATALGSTAGDTSIAAGASVLFDGPTSNFTISEAFSIAGTGSGSLGSAIFVQNGANITISSPVTLTAAATVGVSGAGTVAYTNSAAFTAADQTLTLQGGALSTGNGGSISGVIALGSGGLTKLQGGKWVLSAANTYTGITTISAGTLVAASDSALGTAAGGTTVASGAVLGFQGDINYTTAEPVSIGGTGAISNISGTNTFAGPITLTANSSISAASGSLTLTNAIGETAGPLNLTKSGTGTLVLRAMNTYTGTTTVSAGTLSAASDAALGTTDGGTTVASAATLGFQGDINYATAEPVGIGGNGVGGAGALNNLSGTNTFAGPITMTADSSIGATDGSLTLTKTIGGAYKLTKVGTGTLIISGPQSYSSLLVAAGTATLDSSLSNATITNAGGMLNLNANANNSTINANSSAGTNIHVSQTLSALNIGASGIVTLSAPPPPASDDGALALSGGVAQAVPEPGTLSLVLFGALSLLRRQRRNSGFQIPDSK